MRIATPFTVVDLHLLLFAGFGRRTERLDFTHDGPIEPRLGAAANFRAALIPTCVSRLTDCHVRKAGSIKNAPRQVTKRGFTRGPRGGQQRAGLIDVADLRRA